MSEGSSNIRDHDHGVTSGRCENRDSCEKAICDKDRRRLLGALATGSTLSLAGCTGLFAVPDSGDDEQAVYDVEYEVQDEVLPVRESQTVLGAALDADLDVPYDCKAGFCGACLSQANGDANDLVNMVVNDVDMLTEEAVADGYFLPCTSQPRQNLSLDTDASAGDLLEYQEDEEDEDDGDDGDEDDGDDEQQGTFHTVTYVNEQWSLQVPEDKSLLVAGEDVGMDLPFQCRVGRCGQCLAQVDGDATELVELETNDYGPLDEEAMQDGYTLTCTGFARGDFELESGKYGDLE